MTEAVDTPRPTRSLPVGTATFLLTDVEGSTRMWEQDEDAAARMIGRHYELLAAAIAAHNGMRPEEQGEGDSVVAVFARAEDAVAAALDVQRSVLTEPWGDDRALLVRAALHTGPVQLRDEHNYVGPTIIRCARLRNLAHGGQTLLSDATQTAVAEVLPKRASLRALGVHRMKDLGRPERVWQLDHPDLLEQFAPLRSLDTSPNNLPAQLSSLVGRDVELAELREIIDQHRLVTLTGPGGVGKTRLAVHAAAEAIERHRDGAWWVDLSTVTDPTLVLHAVAKTFGMRKEHGRDLVSTLSDQLGSWDALVVLDNCEQVLEAVAHAIDGLIRATAGLRFVATSREPIGVSGERAWRVPGLATAAAIELFVDRAAQARPGFDPDAATSSVIAEIGHRLDGLPLAIELAAARTRMMHPARIAAALEDRFRILTGGPRTAVGRQQTLEASIAWSYEMLDDAESLVLQRLSVFAGGFTLDAAEEVCADGDAVDGYAVLELLTRLVDKSLVQADGDVEGRYRLLETIRQYAQLRLADASPGPVRDRHLDYYLALAERAAPCFVGPEAVQWLERLEQDHENVRAAFDWADGNGRGEHCLRLVTAMAIFWELRSHFGRGGRWFERALRHETPPSDIRARALWAGGHVALYSDNVETALERASQAIEMATDLGDSSCIARAQNTVAFANLWFDPVGARDSLRNSLALARSIGDDWAVGDGLKMVTISWLVQDDWTAGLLALQDLRAFAESAGNLFFLSWANYGVGYAALRRGDLTTAAAELSSALALCDEIGDPATRGLTIAALGELDALAGRDDAAIVRLEPYIDGAALSLDDIGLWWALITMAGIHLQHGDTDRARALTERLVEAHDDDTGLPFLRSWALSTHAGVLLVGTPSDAVHATAAALLTRAHDIAAAGGNPRLTAIADHHLGTLALQRGELREADQCYHRALDARRNAGLAVEIIESLEALAAIATEHDAHAEAVRLLAATDRIRTGLGIPRPRADAAACAVVLATAAENLDEQVMNAAMSEGVALSLDEAATYATRARGERRRPSAGWDSLTPTELDVVRLTARGLTNPEIGAKLFISRNTVKTHLAHTFTKLGVGTRAELTHLATRRGLV